MFIIKKTNPNTDAAKALLRRVEKRESLKESQAKRRLLEKRRRGGAGWTDLLAEFPRNRRMISTMRANECKAHLKVSKYIGPSKLALPSDLIRTPRGLERKARKRARHRVTPGVTH